MLYNCKIMEVPFSPIADSGVLLDLGLRYHRDGDYLQAKAARQAAFERAETPDQRTRSARDIAYSVLRLYDEDRSRRVANGQASLLEAAEWASIAAHETEASQREQYASRGAVAVVEARQAAFASDRPSEQHIGRRALKHLDEVDALFAHTQESKPDQYRINLIGRLALLEARYGGRLRSLRLGLRAAWFALKSESVRLAAYADPSLSTKARYQAKAKATVRAAGVPLVVLARSTGVDRDATLITDRLM